MSTGARVGDDCGEPTEECRKLRTLCRELKKEKDTLRESLSREQAVNAELIRRFESEVHAASTARSKDNKLIEDLRKELRSCSQEKAFLQVQLSGRTAENQFGDEHTRSFGSEHVKIEKLYNKLKLLEDELIHSESMRLYFMHKAEENDAKLQTLSAQVERLEAAISSTQLESQCEIESMKLDMMALEQTCFEAESNCAQAAKEKTQIDTMFRESTLQLQKAHEKIEHLEARNKGLLEQISSSERCVAKLFSELDGRLDLWLKRNSSLLCHQKHNNILPTNLENDLVLWLGNGYKDIFHPFLQNFFTLISSDECTKYDLQKMPNQIRESERLIAQLKEELRNEKLRSKEEAEDLIQAMAELRFQITDILEEETKRRATIEQASLKRIQELEAEVEKERLKSLEAIRHLNKTRENITYRELEIQHLKGSVEGESEISTIPWPDGVDSPFRKEETGQACIAWHRDGSEG